MTKLIKMYLEFAAIKLEQRRRANAHPSELATYRAEIQHLREELLAAERLDNLWATLVLSG